MSLTFGELFIALGVFSLVLGAPPTYFPCSCFLVLVLKFLDDVHCARAGPKDLPVMARYLGRLTGSASAYVSRARRSFGAFSDQTELTQVCFKKGVSCRASNYVTSNSDSSLCLPVQVHNELQTGLRQLKAIRAELRAGISLSNPGCVLSNLSTFATLQRQAGTSFALPSWCRACCTPALSTTVHCSQHTAKVVLAHQDCMPAFFSTCVTCPALRH